MSKTVSIISHWFPIITFCPVNGWPDFIYVYVHTNQFLEIYETRKIIRSVASWRKLYMEEVAELLIEAIPNAVKVEIHLLFKTHIVSIERT